MTFLRKLGRSVRSTVGRKPLSALPKEVAYPVVEPRAFSTTGGNPRKVRLVL